MITAEVLLVWLQIGAILGGAITMIYAIYHRLNITPISDEVEEAKEEVSKIKNDISDIEKDFKRELEKLSDKCNDLENKDIELSTHMKALDINVERLITKMDDLMNTLLMNRS